MDSRVTTPLRDPKAKDVEVLAREVGIFVGRMVPPPDHLTLLIVYGAFFSKLCKELGLERGETLRDIDRQLTLTMVNHTELEDDARKEGN